MQTRLSLNRDLPAHVFQMLGLKACALYVNVFVFALLCFCFMFICLCYVRFIYQMFTGDFGDQGKSGVLWMLETEP